MNRPILSLVTGTRNREDSLWRLVYSIEDHTTVTYEVIITDAGDKPLDQTGLPLNIRVIPERPRLGYTRGMNAALRQARGKWTLILNDDCEVLLGYAKAAVGYMERHPQIGIGALPYSNKGGPFHVNANSFDGMMYANFPILSTELGNKIGWFDEELDLFYGSDNALGFRVMLAGFGIAEIPLACILHHEIPDFERQQNLQRQQADAAKLRAKYEPLLPKMREAYERCRMVTV